MKLAITFAPVKDDWQAAVDYAVEAERLGIDMAWTAETWGYDGATPLAYLAAKTSRLRLGTGSVWPAVGLHLVWNLIIIDGFSKLTSGPQALLWAGEYGILTTVTLVFPAPRGS